MMRREQKGSGGPKIEWESSHPIPWRNIYVVCTVRIHSISAKNVFSVRIILWTSTQKPPKPVQSMTILRLRGSECQQLVAGSVVVVIHLVDEPGS